MTRTTSIPELVKKLHNFTVRTEEEKKSIFAALANQRPEPVKKILISQTTVESKIIGTLTQNKNFADWWTSEEIAIPFWDHQKLTIAFTDYHPNEDEHFLAEADELLATFLKKTATDRLAASKYVYRNCMDFLDAIGFNEDDEAMWNMPSEEHVWQFVTCTELYISRDHFHDKRLYLQIMCECKWEEEHGLQLVYDQQGKLIRVSAQDGSAIGWQGDGMITT